MRILGIEFSKTETSSVAVRNNPVLSRDDLWFPLGETALSGAYVTTETAARHITVYTCVKILSQTIASIPLILYERKKDGSRRRAEEFLLFDLLNKIPNDVGMTRMEFIETMMRHVLLRGNAYAHIVWERYEPIELIPLNPDYMFPQIVAGTIVNYQYRDPFRLDEKPQNFEANQILHIKGPSDDGVIGKSPIQQLRDTIGLALSKRQYESNLYKHGVSLSGVIEHPEILTDEVEENLRKSFAETYGGASNAYKVAILEDGMKFKQIGMSNADAQFIESLNLTARDIAGAFQVPLYLLGHMEKTTFRNVEQLGQQFKVFTILPWTVRIELAIMRDIINNMKQGIGRKELYAEFLIDGLSRGDQETRYKSYQVGFQTSFLSANDIRRFENLDPIEGGDRYFVQGNNMVPLDRIDDYYDNVMSKKAQPAQPLKIDGGDGAESQNDGEDGEDDEDARVSELCLWYRDLFKEVVQRSAQRERKQILAVLKEGKTLASIEAEIMLRYAKQGDFMVEAFETVVRSFSQQVCAMSKAHRRLPPEHYLSDYVKKYCAKKLDTISQIGDLQRVIEHFDVMEKTDSIMAETFCLMNDILATMRGQENGRIETKN